MINILALKSSILGDYSSSSKLIDELLAKYKQQQATITEHDLAQHPLPVLDGEIATAMRSPEELNDKQRNALVLSDKLISELVSADLLVIAAPMYNFMIPTQLKNWIDLVARAGKTFSYSEQGPKGLLSGTRAIIVTTRGGMHKEQASDQQIPYLKNILNFIGISDVEVVYAESLAMGPETAELNIEQARKQLSVFA